MDFHLTATDNWEVVLIVDSREVGGGNDRSYFANKFLLAGIQCERRGVPLGDYVWLARHGPSGREFVMDAIVERKTVNDLAQSIKDGRYAEQKARLLSSGLSRPIYVVEGDISKQTVLPPGSGTMSLATAIHETRVHAGICVMETRTRDETAAFILDLHALLQRERGVGFTAWQCEDREWTRYKKTVAKHGSQDVGEVFQRMLKQVPGCGTMPALAISTQYPTPTALASAYFFKRGRYADPEGEKTRRIELLSTIQVQRKQVGPALSHRMAKVFCQADYMTTVAASEHQEREGGEGVDDGEDEKDPLPAAVPLAPQSSQVTWEEEVFDAAMVIDGDDNDDGDDDTENAVPPVNASSGGDSDEEADVIVIDDDDC